ncbi:MAG: DUF2760 domain-containing protein [Myxococcota bacterium]
MANPTPGFFTRFALAFVAFFRVVFDRDFAAHVMQVRRGELPPAPEGEPRPETAAPPEPPAFRETPADAALQLLGILQREGRLVDFLEEDVSTFSDGEIGAAARVVHEGCRKALHEHFHIDPIRPEAEGERITVQPDFDAAAVRLTGNVVGEPPFTGTLQHRGWRVSDVKLPKLAVEHDPTVLAPAELEL